jgi:5'-nucleotidase
VDTNETATPSLPLMVGVSTRAMFDLEEEHAIFEQQGVHAYSELQLARENERLKPGPAFEVTRRLLALNPDIGPPLVQVILLSRNAPNLSLRAFRSLEHYGIPIKHGSFTSGRSVAPFVQAWNADLFLSNDDADVRSVVASGIAAARLGSNPLASYDERADEVRCSTTSRSHPSRQSAYSVALTNLRQFNLSSCLKR